MFNLPRSASGRHNTAADGNGNYAALSSLVFYEPSPKKIPRATECENGMGSIPHCSEVPK